MGLHRIFHVSLVSVPDAKNTKNVSAGFTRNESLALSSLSEKGKDVALIWSPERDSNPRTTAVVAVGLQGSTGFASSVAVARLSYRGLTEKPVSDVFLSYVDLGFPTDCHGWLYAPLEGDRRVRALVHRRLC